MTEKYDIVVIGGGIHGAGVLQAAAANGYRALLLEQYPEPAQGTSGRSSKLIHGGLRYLETGEIKLVYECLRERALLLKNAPDLVRLRPFHIPVYRDSRRGSALIRTGLGIYALLGGLKKDTVFKTIPKTDWQTLNGLKHEDLLAVFQYADAQTDDAALTQAVLESARTLGAETQFSAEFTAATNSNEDYTVTYTNTGSNTSETVQTNALVNAAGPWVNHVMKKITPVPESPEIELVQGTHILLPGNIDGKIYYLQAPDGRAVFVMPWKNQLMVGTTEQVFHGDNPADVQASDTEINYLLAIFNYYFPNFYPSGPATRDMLSDSFAGLRVLPKTGTNVFKRSRETLYIRDHQRKPRLIAIYGGKLTSYRLTAENTIRLLRKQLPRRDKKADTRKLKLGG